MKKFLGIVLLLLGMCSGAWGSVAINSTNFPDYNFMWYVRDFDTDGNGYLSDEEIAAVTSMYVGPMTIWSLKGIEYFTELTELECMGDEFDEHQTLTTLDLSKNTKLERLVCYGYRDLTKLDLSKNTALTYVECCNNGLATLDVSGCVELVSLDCRGNKLTTLDLTKNKALKWLECDGNWLKKLDVNGCTSLTKLDCDDNKLTSLDLSNNTALEELNCGNNQLTELDVSYCVALKKLTCYSNKLTELSSNTVLEFLYCSSNQLTTLDVSECVALIKLDCQNNQLTELVLGKNVALTELDCIKNQLTALDVSECVALTKLDCQNNQLGKLDVSKCVALTELKCFDNRLTALDVSKNTKLSIIYHARQTTSPLYIAATGNTSYPYRSNFSNYMTSSQFANVSDVQGLDSNDTSVTTTYAEGVAYFAARPAKLKYNYATGYGTEKMDVTISGTLDVAAPTLSGTFANGKLNAKYSKSITVNGNSESYVWAMTSGDVPPGLKLTFEDDKAKLSGKPKKSGTFTFELTVTDENNASVSKTFTVKITKPKISGTFKDSTTYASYNDSVKVTGGTKPYTWTISKGTLPKGLDLISSNDKAIISGTPTKSGSYTFKLRVEDKNGAAVSKEFTMNISKPVISGTLSGGFVKADYSGTLSVSGGVEPYTWTVSGDLPAGLGFTSSGDKAVISGKPSAAGTFKFKIKVEDKNGASATKSFSVKISQPKISGKLANGAVNAKYSKTLTVSGGVAPYSWNVNGDLPAGLELTWSGDKAVVSEKPTEAGTYEFAVVAADTNGATAVLSCKVTITKPEITGTFANGALKAGYAEAVKVTGGKAGYTWTKSGNIPTGLTLTFAGSAAVLTGTPTEVGSFTFRLTVSDKNGVSDTKSFTVEITKPEISWTFRDGTVDEAYTDIVRATGGTGPYKWTKSGTLPTGLELTFTDSLAILSGTPTEAGSFKFKLKVTDKNKGTLTRSFTVKIVAGDEADSSSVSTSKKNGTSSDYGRARTKQTTSSGGSALRENSPGLLGEDSTSVNIYAELKVVSDDVVESYDGKDSDMVKVKAGVPLRFSVTNWGTEVDGLVVYVDDKALSDVEVSGEGEFTLPAEKVHDDFKVGVKARSTTGERESEELYIVAE